MIELWRIAWFAILHNFLSVHLALKQKVDKMYSPVGGKKDIKSKIYKLFMERSSFGEESPNGKW